MRPLQHNLITDIHSKLHQGLDFLIQLLMGRLEKNLRFILSTDLCHIDRKKIHYSIKGVFVGLFALALRASLCISRVK